MLKNYSSKGWYKESIRHSLASKGVETTPTANAKLNEMVNPQWIENLIESDRNILQIRSQFKPGTLYYDYTIFAPKSIDREMSSTLTIKRDIIDDLKVTSTIRLPAYDGKEVAQEKLEKLRELVEEELEPKEIKEWDTENFHMDMHVDGDWWGGHVGFKKSLSEDELRSFMHDYMRIINKVVTDE